jgi:hypothetical protein
MGECEVCSEHSTHRCSGLDVPVLEFCAKHASSHEAECSDVARGASQMTAIPRGDPDAKG